MSLVEDFCKLADYSVLIYLNEVADSERLDMVPEIIITSVHQRLVRKSRVTEYRRTFGP